VFHIRPRWGTGADFDPGRAENVVSARSGVTFEEPFSCDPHDEPWHATKLVFWTQCCSAVCFTIERSHLIRSRPARQRRSGSSVATCTIQLARRLLCFGVFLPSVLLEYPSIACKVNSHLTFEKTPVVIAPPAVSMKSFYLAPRACSIAGQAFDIYFMMW
jgi:hypothetical protein